MPTIIKFFDNTTVTLDVNDDWDDVSVKTGLRQPAPFRLCDERTKDYKDRQWEIIDEVDNGKGDESGSHTEICIVSTRDAAELTHISVCEPLSSPLPLSTSSIR
jgi:hypothetical protein